MRRGAIIDAAPTTAADGSARPRTNEPPAYATSRLISFIKSA
jgi:hypothetical protein